MGANILINKEQLGEWKNQQITQEIFQEIKTMISRLKDALADGQTVSDSPGHTALSTARMVGEIAGLSQLLNISYEEEGQDDKEEI